MQTADRKKEYQKEYYKEHKESLLAQSKKYYTDNTMQCKLRQQSYRKANPELILWKGAKYRAIKNGISFDIEVADIIIPSFCPILKVPLSPNVDGKVPNKYSPSLDRIVPSLGYTKGNIQVISFLANTMKSDANKQDLLIFANWVIEFYGGSN